MDELKTQLKKINFYNLLTIGFFGLVTFHNFHAYYQNIWNRVFRGDEIQHTHIAWNSLNNLIIYRDFYDVHGPLYAFLNKFILQILEQPAQTETLFILRQVSFSFAILMLIPIFFICKTLFKNNYIGYIAIAIFSTWDIIKVVVFDIRPDIIQNFFVLLGIYFFVSHKESGTKKLILLAGLCLGIAAGFNAKSLIIPVIIILNQAIEAVIRRDSKPLKILIPLFSGILIIYLLLSTYFLSHNALSQFYYYNFLHGITFLSKYVDFTGTFLAFCKYSFKDNLLLTLLTLFSLTRINFKDSGQRLIVLISIIMVYGNFKGFYIHYSSIFLPSWSILAAYSIASLIQVNSFKAKKSLDKKSIFILTLILITLIASPLNIFKKTFGKNNELIKMNRQLKEIEWVLKNTDRDNLMVNLYFDCPAYVFNKDFQYFWQNSHVKLGEHPQKIKLITASPTGLSKLKKENSAIKNYLLDHFQLVEIDGQPSCIWQRNKSEFIDN